MDAHPALVISKELASEERLLWSGRPQQGVVFRRTDLFLIPFSLLWCEFVVFWEATVLTRYVKHLNLRTLSDIALDERTDRRGGSPSGRHPLLCLVWRQQLARDGAHHGAVV